MKIQLKSGTVQLSLQVCTIKTSSFWINWKKNTSCHPRPSTRHSHTHPFIFTQVHITLLLTQHCPNSICDKAWFLSQKSLGWPRVPPGPAEHLKSASALLRPASTCFPHCAQDSHWYTIWKRHRLFHWLETIHTSHEDQWHCGTHSHTVWGWVWTSTMSGTEFQAQEADPEIYSQVSCVNNIQCLTTYWSSLFLSQLLLCDIIVCPNYKG